MHKTNTSLYLKGVIMLSFALITSNLLGQFVHPGIWHKRSDLDRMKAMVEAQIDPWYTSFLNLQADSKSSYDYVVQKDPNNNNLSRENPRDQRNQYESDSVAAYQLSLMWYITDDSRYAEKAIDILNAWSSLTNFYGGGTEPLSAGLYGAPLINAAEIIKSTYNGWSASEIQAFKDMLVYPGYSNTTVPQSDIDNDNVTFYWRTYMGDPGRHGNQGLLAWRTVMAIGIFNDNEIIYDRALRYLTGLPSRSDDLPYHSGPASIGALTASCEFEESYQFSRLTTTPDYGYDDQIQHYIYDNGQCQEAWRDQNHSNLGISSILESAEMAWNQGDDVYSYLNNRILEGCEYLLRYNLSFEQGNPLEPTSFYQRHTRSGRWRGLKINPEIACGGGLSRGGNSIFAPRWELASAHYDVRAGLTSQTNWTIQTRDFAISQQGYEGSDGVHCPGWGGLSYRRPEGCAGDPISGFDSNGLPIFAMNVLPMTIEAENFDHFAGDGEGRTYVDTTSGNNGSQYRTDENVDIQSTSDSIGDYNVGWIDTGEELTYTVHVPSSGNYDISIRYSAPTSNGTLRANFAGTDKTGNVTVTGTGGWNTWDDLTLATDISLSEGVQSLRLIVGGTRHSFNLNSITISQSAGSGNLALNKSATQSSTAHSGSASRAVDGNTNGAYSGNSVTHTASEVDPWWEVDLGGTFNIGDINIFNRTDNCCEARLTNFTVSVLDNSRASTYIQSFSSYPDPSITVNAGGAEGRYVRIQLDDTNSLSLAEVEVFSGAITITNLAENQPVTTSGEQVGNFASNAVDDDTNTRWSVSGFPQWLEVDLGSIKSISRTELVCFSDRAYQFIVESKTTSGGSYTQVVDRSSNTTPGTESSPITDTFSPSDARYVRITVQGASGYSGSWVSQLEFRVFGN
ncbi:discoidin domain-containing protein [Puniceicoccaceae bacterium K14]|nr:discoidin domain-containing protein [Puniceicoccaceae bacterium K14]